MAGSISAYVAQVDHVLGAGQGLFAAAVGPGGHLLDDGTGNDGGEALTAMPPCAETTGVAGAVREAAERYWHDQASLSRLDADTRALAGAGRDAAQQGHAGASAMTQTAHTQSEAIAPAGNSSAGVRLLVLRMDERLAAMQNQIADTQASHRVLASRLRQLAAQYRRLSPSGPVREPAPGG